ncbi:MFS transporter [Vibrio ouci]|uniref:MFS transporter n=1 Tax=Vibrio ouci TaxID=2499078 RepID=A0A4Y8WCF6_9VIBR|nr:MFS transporter [Vibrio ouci]TFH89971.1 MFS transporter [Vibrio ouci]
MRRTKVLVCLAALSVLSMFPMDVFISSFEDLASYFSIPYRDTISSVTLFTYGFGVGVLVVGILAEKLGVTTVLLGSLVFLLLSNLLSLGHSSYELFLGSRFMQGLFSSSFVLSTFIVRNCFNEEEGVRVRALIASISAIAITLSPMLGALLTTAFGWGSIIVVASCACVVTMLCFLSISSELRDENLSAVRNNFLRSREFWVLNLVSTLNFSIHFVFVILSVKIFTQDFSGSLQDYGWMMIFYGVALFVTNTIIIKFNTKLAFTGSNYWYLLSIAVLAVIIMQMSTNDNLGFYSYFPIIVLATFFGVYLSNITLNKAIFVVNGTPTVSSVVGSIRFITTGTIGWLGFSYGSGMTSIALLYFLSSISSLILLRSVRPNKTEP